jgi:hypothetical protein
MPIMWGGEDTGYLRGVEIRFQRPPARSHYHALVTRRPVMCCQKGEGETAESGCCRQFPSCLSQHSGGQSSQSAAMSMASSIWFKFSFDMEELAMKEKKRSDMLLSAS